MYVAAARAGSGLNMYCGLGLGSGFTLWNLAFLGPGHLFFEIGLRVGPFLNK
jgi:hypothetical protein